MVTDEFMSGAIIGFLEGEGSVEPIHRVVRIVNSDKLLLSTIQQYLSTKGVHSRLTEYNVEYNKRVGNRSRVYRITITHRVNLIKVYELYGDFESEKKNRLGSVLAAYKRKIYAQRDLHSGQNP